MPLKVTIFGQLTDLIGQSEIALNDLADTDQLYQILIAQYPALAQAKFVIAVDRQIIRQNTFVQATSEIALLPPFSGG